MSLAVSRGLDPHFPAPAPEQKVDRSFVVRRLHKNATTLLAAHPRTTHLGPDHLVENLASSLGFETVDLAILRVMVGPNRYTLICAPERIWNGRKRGLLELKRVAAAAGRSCVLVPEGAIQRQPRLGTARTIEEASGVDVTMEQRMDVLVHLIEHGYSTLFDCACAIKHPSPFSAVLHLVAMGVIKMRGDGRLSPDTRIDLPDPAMDAS